ncbi:MAG: hypothetical protein R3E90_15165 [Marinicella sp.]|nr:hypothetical protein [Xanthomonadales bacterium]
MRILILTYSFCLMLAHTSQSYAGTTILTVGTDQNCDFNTIQSAINFVPDDDPQSFAIHITNQQVWQENLSIGNKLNLGFKGQFVNCQTAASNTHAGSLTTLDGSGLLTTTIFVNASQGIHFTRFIITGSTFGGMTIGTESSVSLIQSSVINNSNNSGGGIKISNDSFIFIYLSEISNNVASHGGGLHCDDSEVIVNRSQIMHNQANETGGGIYATNHCELSLNGASSINNTTTELMANTAGRFGGGLYAELGSNVVINDPNTINTSYKNPVFIAQNKISNTITNQNGAGAGVYLNGSGTQMTAYKIVFDRNSIDDNLMFVGGAAMAIDNQAILQIKHTPGDDNHCGVSFSSNHTCNQIKHNITKSGDAAVIKITGGAQADIRNISIFGNETSTNTNQLASVLNGDLIMQGALIYDNGTTPNPPQVQVPTRLFRVSPAGTFHGDFLTIADNRLWGGWVIESIGSPQLNLTRSIIAEDPIESVLNDSINNPSAKLFKCLLTHENNSFTGTGITVGSPTFQPTLPYHLGSGSLGVNLCTHGFGDLFPEDDIDGEERGPCPNLCAPQRFDAGADEFHFSDLIFKNGFAPLL